MQYRKIQLKNNEENKDILTRLLEIRNIKNKDEIYKFLNPKKEDFISPYAFCDMEKAKKRILESIQKKEKILIWGDFDCDGVTSSTILYKTLNELKANVITFIPDRLLHGHGLNSKELITLVAKEKVKLVITVDCGISNISEINLLKSLRVDTIITDHHNTDTELPDALAVINPQVKGALKEDLSVDDITSLTYNSGSVVAYKLAMALLEESTNQNLKDELLTIAAAGAVADVVPLIGENRSIVAVGLEILNNKNYDSNRAIYTLLSKNLNNRKITSYDLAFILAPRINAVGRLANAKLSFEFLNCQNDDELNIIIEKLDNYNTIRQSKCSETYNDIVSYLNNNKEEEKNDAVILINDSWHIGVIGIVASHIVEEYQKPCFLMTVDENNCARCSIRSNDLINVYQVLKENQSLFKGFGGHKLAGGCSFDLNQISFEEVKSALLKTIKEQKGEKTKENVLFADIKLNPKDLNFDLLDTINKLEPFGQNNQMPLFAMFDVNLEDYRTIGKEQKHLKMTFEKDGIKLDSIRWRQESLLIEKGSLCDIAFYPKLNKFNDTETIQLEIEDIYYPDLNLKRNNSKIKIYDHRLKQGILPQIDDYLKNENLDVLVWAKTTSTKEKLEKYDNIKKCTIKPHDKHKILMFFDYPSSNEEFSEILYLIKPEKIHFMNCKIDENLENYIKQINGMIKYSSNKLKGEIDLKRLSFASGVSENFIQIVLEIMENIDSLKILDIDKIEYIKPFSYEDFKNNPLFEILKEEFNKLIDFKKNFLKTDISEIQNFIEQNIQ